MATSHPVPVDGDTQFIKGMNSQLDPISLAKGVVRSAMNMVNRGGVFQCRPGYKWKFNMPDGRIQGGHFFIPTGDLPILVFAIAGLVYSSPYPYKDYSQVQGLQFREDAEDVFFCTAEKAAQYNPDGSITLITPFKVLMVQDGFTPPGAWDGNSAQHILDPKGTPMGTHMFVSGDRLWVARLNELFACDINDPLSNREGLYISNAKSFLLDKPITGIVEVTSKAQAQLLVFTDTTTTVFQSSIRNRSQWASTENFQQVLFPTIGCSSHRSLVTQYGLLWWYSRFGLTNLDAALNTYLTSEFRYQDNEMAASKAYLHNDLSKIACATHENYLLTSVPYCDLFNTHTWVLDKSPAETVAEQSPNAWNGFWTGTRPTDWMFGPVLGENRIFHFSRDYDGVNRCWEAFSDQRADNGCPITWSLETRGYTAGNVQKKNFRFAQIYLGEIEDTFDIAAFWNGVSKGAYKRCLTKRIKAQVGPFVPDKIYESADELYSLKKQHRDVLTVDVGQSPPNVTSCDVESLLKEQLDTGFQVLLVGSGPAAIRAIRIFISDEPDIKSGKCEDNEFSDENFVRFDGRGSDELADLDEPVEEFTSSDIAYFSYGGDYFTGHGDSVSVISQDDAGKIADCHAENQIAIWQAWVLPKYDGVPVS